MQGWSRLRPASHSPMGLQDPLDSSVVVSEDRQQHLASLLTKRKVPADPPGVAGLAWGDRCHGVGEAEGMDLSVIGCRVDVNIPPIDPETWSHEGTLLALNMLGVGR